MHSTGHIHDIAQKDIRARAAKLSSYDRKIGGIIKKKDYEQHESALAVPYDEEFIRDIKEKVEHLRDAKHVILVGIGGSSLATEAMYQAVAYTTNPSLYVLDAIEPGVTKHVEVLITRKIKHLNELAIVVVSKSGETTETLVNAFAVAEICEKRFGKDAYKRVVVIGNKTSPLLKAAAKKGIIVVHTPEAITGRFSAFTATGLIPLLLAHIDIDGFLEGARAAREKAHRERMMEEAALLSLLAEKKGVDTIDYFTFNRRLIKLGYWYRQLFAESLGKKETKKGEKFQYQLLPTITSSIDLHSMAQLYFSGYDEIFTEFVHADVEGGENELSKHWMLAHAEHLERKTPRVVKNAIRDGVLHAYEDAKLPHSVYHMERITLQELGLYMAQKMLEVMYLGYLFNIDAFDQPQVELYKSETRRILSKGA